MENLSQILLGALGTGGIVGVIITLVKMGLLKIQIGKNGNGNGHTLETLSSQMSALQNHFNEETTHLLEMNNKLSEQILELTRGTHTLINEVIKYGVKCRDEK